jgi:hypothetical protein
VAIVIVDQLFLKWGLCFEILSDQGLEFEASLTRELLQNLGIAKLRTSGYMPSVNGAIEVHHKVLNSMLAKVISRGLITLRFVIIRRRILRLVLHHIS